MPFLPYREPVKLASVEEIPETLRTRGVDAVLLVTDANLRRAGVTAPLEEALRGAGIREEDIPHMARYAAKEANPLYPVPLETDARELEGFYFAVMPKENKGEKTE